jgi:hypothetical protein
VHRFLDSVELLERGAGGCNLLGEPCSTGVGDAASVRGHSHQALQVGNEELGNFRTGRQG